MQVLASHCVVGTARAARCLSYMAQSTFKPYVPFRNDGLLRKPQARPYGSTGLRGPVLRALLGALAGLLESARALLHAPVVFGMAFGEPCTPACNYGSRVPGRANARAARLDRKEGGGCKQEGR